MAAPLVQFRPGQTSIRATDLNAIVENLREVQLEVQTLRETLLGFGVGFGIVDQVSAPGGPDASQDLTAVQYRPAIRIPRKYRGVLMPNRSLASDEAIGYPAPLGAPCVLVPRTLNAEDVDRGDLYVLGERVAFTDQCSSSATEAPAPRSLATRFLELLGLEA